MAKKYQVYGIGNALVDFEIETNPQELVELEVEKGVMTLIEEDRQEALFQAFQGKHHSRACGGSAANTIIGAQSFGSQCFYSCKVADDETGRFYRDDLLAHGVHSNLSNESLEQGKTGKCLVMITEDADRTMNTFLGITGNIGYEQIDEEALINSEYLYVEGYLSSSPVALEAVLKAKKYAQENGVKTAFSLSDPNMVKFCRDGLDAIIGDGVDILFCNFDEATLYSGCDNIEDAANALSKLAKTVVITLGAEGAIIVEQNKTIKIEGNKVEAIDTNGAGDLFAGSFLHAVTQGLTLEQAGELASFASAQLVTQFGPRLTEEKFAIVNSFAKKLVV
ncbi:adenosine kinase [Aliikangiella coralliicola]|uniref:Adenosine kinase n=1 Tax=Aliikangiella coralliicola TaxID=2592383 RepID=A0A545UAP3_9GAMM|nr:adenosine kinase [Aliikangiella coralliicola]TQV86536.1 adenosine kinase [Aliikangiella coralliicola]